MANRTTFTAISVWFLSVSIGHGQDAKVSFGTDVLPILQEHCFSCHRGQRAASGLRLDQRVEILGETNGRPLAKPGDSRGSSLHKAITHADPKRRMPKDDTALSARQIAILTKWIDEGLAWDEKALPASPKVDHWAFQPVKRPTIPEVASTWPRNAIDRFIAALHEKAGVSPADKADDRTWIRRVHLDLTGLPPRPEDIERFAKDINPKRHERLIDDLLSSPHYGERWGRHWLDVARFGESEGYESNHLRMHAWRYRDWVVKAFNMDKPFREFVAEQIAGDEIVPYADANLIATGFLAAARLSSNEEDRHRLRNDILIDVVNTTASAFLGVTLQCAQCHNHKFDPITARDYYRFQGFFVKGQPGNYALKDKALWTIYNSSKPADYDAAIAERDALHALAKKRKVEQVRTKLSKEADRVYFTLTMSERTPEQERLARQTDLAFQFGTGQVEATFDAEERDRFNKLKKKIADMETTMSEKPQTFGFYSPVTSPHAIDPLPMKGFYPLELDATFLRRNQAYLLAAGDVHRPSLPLDAGVPAQFDNGGSASRRLELANWLTDPRNPLTARVYVNRVWHLHFGRGLVAAPGDFGVKGAAPTHPELLDWLTAEFLEQGGSTKHLHRLILGSATYRQSKQATETTLKLDPDNLLWTRWQPRRLEAEAIHDAMLFVSGELDPSLGGPSVLPKEPKTVQVAENKFKDHKSVRRAIYQFQKREAPPTIQALFDGPSAMAESCGCRQTTTVPLQSLYLLNSEFGMARATELAKRISEQATTPRGQINAGFRLVLQRPPSEHEASYARRFLDLVEDEESRLILFSQTLLNLNEFLYLE